MHGNTESALGDSRRHFLQLLATFPALALVPAGQAAAQEGTAPPAELGAWLEIVKQRWGDRLSADELKAIEENLGWMLRSGTRLREAALQNSDEPDVIFRAEAPETAP